MAVAAITAAYSYSASAKDIALLRRADIGSSQLALDVVKKVLAKKGFELKETTLAGDDNAIAKAIGDSSAPPAAALVSGDEIRALGEQKLLGDISANALGDRWVSRIPFPLQPLLVSSGRWVAAPLDVMPINGLWLNSALMDKIGGVEPNTIDTLFALLNRAKQAEIAPIAIGGDPRDVAALFEMLIVAAGGADVYKKAFIDLNEQTLRSEAIKNAFDNLARLRGLVTAGDAGLGAKDAAQRVIKGEALAYVGPGSTRLQFAAAGKLPDKDYRCLRFPGTEGAILFQLDLVAMLKTSPGDWAAQSALADAVMDPKVQEGASLARGAVPVRGGDVDLTKFDACAKKDVDDVQRAAAIDVFLGSAAYGFAERASVTAAYIDVVAKFYSGEIPSAEAAAAALYSVLTAGKP